MEIKEAIAKIPLRTNQLIHHEVRSQMDLIYKRKASNQRHEILTPIRESVSQLDTFKNQALAFKKNLISMIAAQQDNITEKDPVKTIALIHNLLFALEDMILDELNVIREEASSDLTKNSTKFIGPLDLLLEYVDIVKLYWDYRIMVLKLNPNLLSKDNVTRITTLSVIAHLHITDELILEITTFLNAYFENIFSRATNIQIFSEHSMNVIRAKLLNINSSFR